MRQARLPVCHRWSGADCHAASVPTYSLRACPRQSEPERADSDVQLRPCRARARRRGRLGGARQRHAADRRRRARRRSRRRSRRSTRARCASPSGRPDGAWKVNQWAKKAVLLGFRLQDMGPQSGGPQGGGWWDKVDSKFQGWTEPRLARRRLPRGADRGGAPLGLHRAGGGADALLRQRRRLRRRGDDGRHLGDRRAPAPRSAGTCTSRAASASAGCSSRCRRARRSSRTTASSARAARWSRAASCARARCSAWASSSASRPRSSTGRPARSSTARCRPIRWWWRAACRASRCRTARPAPSLYCAVIVKRVDERTRSKTAINELLRD